MSKRQNATPKMLPMVLQAIADLRENRGSTAKNIIDRVQHVLEKPKPQVKAKNVVTQVKRAIKHAVDVGIVQQRSGRYKISKILPRTPKAVAKKPTKPVKKLSDSKQPKPTKKLVDKPAKRTKRRYSSYSTGPTETTCTTETHSYASSISEATSGTSYRDDKSKSKRSKSGKKQKFDKPHKETVPAEQHSYEEPSEEPNQQDSETKINAQNEYENMGQYILEDQVGNECDNPDCLCNLKSDPMEGNYEDDIRCNDYLN